MLQSKRYITTCLLLLLIPLSNHSFAQGPGWKLIAENDLVTAKALFERTLESNPNNEDALCGMIFISEVFQDQLNYQKYSNQLIEAEWKEEYFALFKHMYQGTPDEILKHSLDPSLKLKPILAKSDTLFYNRRFKESKALMEGISSDLKWSVIGPFTNIAGSGHVEKNVIETEIFKSSKVYKNENGLELKWVPRYQSKPTGEVFFNENLPYMRQGTYYANTFLNTTSNQTIQLRIARNTPMKIWLDDVLVFENNGNIKYTWDGEIVELKLEKGEHRILVKSSTYVEPASISELYLSFNDQYNESDLSLEFLETENNPFNKKRYAAKGARTASFAIRLTDTKGKLQKNITSDLFGKNKVGSFKPKLKEKKWIDFFQKKIKKDNKDLKNYYLLCKAYLLKGLNEEGEEWFYKHTVGKEYLFFSKYLLAKFYAVNDKGNVAEALLSGQDNKKTPVVALLINDLQKINLKTEESTYVQKVLQLLNLTPTHWEGLVGYLNWMEKRGMKAEKEKFIQAFLADYPNTRYEKRLKYILDKKNNRPEAFMEMNEGQRNVEAVKAISRIKKVFDVYDYLNVIDYHKRKKDTRKVVRMYDDLINFFPYRAYYHREKANFLFEEKEYTAALTACYKALEIQPYHARSIEKVGDIFLEQKKTLLALEYFNKAKNIDKATQKGNYALARINEKIEEMQPSKVQTNHFQQVDSEEVMVDNSWRGKYLDEGSVILLFNIQAKLTEDNNLQYHQNLTIKILNQAGANYWTEADFSFLGEIAKVKVVKPNGTEITPSRNWNLVVFQNLEPEDIILIEGNSLGNMTREIPDEMFHMSWLSMEVPVYRSLLELVAPPDKDINFVCNKVDCNVQTRKEADAKIYSWDHYEIAKNENEEALSDKMDAFAWIMLSTQRDWSKVVKWYQRKTYLRQKVNYELKGILDEIITKEMTEEEKVESVYNYLTTEINYSFVSFLNSNYVPKLPANTISAKVGDCKDVSSVMIGMLEELGIPAWYVLVRTEDYTAQEPRPSILVFNHVIVGYQLADGVMRYVDLTTDYFSKNTLPKFDANQWALIVKDRERNIFRLPNDQLDPEKSMIQIATKAKITEQRNIEMIVHMQADGVVAGDLRESLNSMSIKDEGLKFISESLAVSDFDQMTIRDLDFENLKEISKPLKTKLNLKAYNHLEKVSKFQILQIPLLNPITTQPALFDDTRRNNLDLTKLFQIAPSEQIIELEIPNGFELLEIPEPTFITNEFGTYELFFSKIKKGIQVTRKLQFKNSLVAQHDYPAFKKFYLEMLDGDRTKLAIRKRAAVVSQ